MPSRRTGSQHKQSIWRSIFVLGCCLYGSFLLFHPSIAFAHASASNAQQANDTRHQQQHTMATPSIDKITVGFGGIYQSGDWIPIQVTLSNTGADFSGKIQVVPLKTQYVTASAGNDVYQQDVSLPSGAQKQVTLDAPLGSTLSSGNVTNVKVTLLDADGNQITSRQATTTPVSSTNVLVGILSDTPNNFDRLNVSLSNLLKSAGQTIALSSTTFPTRSELLQSFSLIVLDDFSTATLSQDQLTALQNWVNDGGKLIVAGGPEWRKTLSPLPGTLLPATLSGDSSIPAGTSMLPVSSISQTQSSTLPASAPITRAQPRAGSTTIQTTADNKLPLIIRGQVGRGNVYLVTYDPIVEPLAFWKQTNAIWENLLLRSIGDTIINDSSSPGINTGQQWTPAAAMSGLLQIFFPNAYPSLWLILGLLASYILILGPIRMIIVRRTKKRQYSWRIVLATILVFTLLSYGLAVMQKGTAVVNSSVTVLRLNHSDTTGSDGQITTYVGVFVPSQGNYTIHIPGTNLVSSAQTSSSTISGSTNTQQATTITTSSDGNSTDAELNGVNIWTNHTLVAQHDTHTAGGLNAQLQLQQSTVSGTVTNTLPYDMEDSYVAVAGSYISLGHFPAHSTRTISLALQTSNQATPGTTIASQIASQQGIQVSRSYSSEIGNTSVTDERTQHILTLEALSGSTCDSYSCYQSTGNITTANGTVYATNSTGSTNDPLLIPGADATFFGWIKDPQAYATINQSNDNITINGSVAQGTHSILVQAPLAIHYHGNLHIPSSLITNEVVALEQDQSANIQEPASGIYTMTTGTITFEYTAPSNSHIQSGHISVTSTSSSLANKVPAVQSTGASSDINHIQAYLYNWHTGKWDSFVFNQSAFTAANAQEYIGPYNRILLCLHNQDSRLGTIPFNRPAISIDGVSA